MRLQPWAFERGRVQEQIRAYFEAVEDLKRRARHERGCTERMGLGLACDCGLVEALAAVCRTRKQLELALAGEPQEASCPIASA